MFGQIITGNDLKDRFQNFINNDTSITDEIIAQWIDDALADLEDIAFITSSETYDDVEANVEYQLPYDFKKLDNFEIYDSDNNTYEEYDNSDDVIITKGDMIRFSEDLDTITMNYFYVIEQYDDLDTELPCNRLIRPCLYFHLISEYYLRDGEGNTEEYQMGLQYKERYQQRLAKAMDTIKSRDSEEVCSTIDTLPRSRETGRSDDLWEYYDGNNDVS